MNTRTMALTAALAALGVGLGLTFLQWHQAPPPVPSMVPAIAKQQIAPYTYVTQDMVAAGDPTSQREALAAGLWPVSAAIGNMSTDLITPGEALSSRNLLPAQSVRFVQDMGLEIVSFAAGVDKMVGGKLRPGNLINLYGYGTDRTNEPFTTLVEGRMWVVAVSAAGQPVSSSTAVPDPRSGVLIRTGTDRDRPTSLITVAVAPATAFRVIDALGAQGLNAWVTLAANRLAEMAPRATPATIVLTPERPVGWQATATAFMTWARPTEPPATGTPLGGGWGAQH